MFRIVRKSRERLITDAYEARLAERERLITVLVEQIEYLRAQLRMPTSTVSMAAATPVIPELNTSETEMVLETAPTDEEEELEAMRQAGVISEAEYQEWKGRLIATSPDDIIE